MVFQSLLEVSGRTLKFLAGERPREIKQCRRRFRPLKNFPNQKASVARNRIIGGQVGSKAGLVSEPQTQVTGQPAVIHYSLGRPADVTVWLDDSRGQRLVLRERQPRPPDDDYQLSFDGT